MKRLLFSSLVIFVIMMIVGCKGTPRNGSATSGTNGEISDSSTSVIVDSTIGMATDSLIGKKQIDIPKDSIRTPSSTHNAPNQVELDSLKQAKTKGKK